MHCASCVASIETALKDVIGVRCKIRCGKFRYETSGN